MNIQEKYNSARPYIKNGDLILFHSDKILGKLIQYFDKAYYNHVGIAWEANGRLFILDSNAPGVEPQFLSTRMNDYSDFCIVDLKFSPELKQACLDKIMDKSQIGIKYNFLRLLQIAIYKKLHLDIKRLDGGSNRAICSQFANEYTNLFPVNCYAKMCLATPQDFVRFADSAEVAILLNDHLG